MSQMDKLMEYILVGLTKERLGQPQEIIPEVKKPEKPPEPEYAEIGKIMAKEKVIKVESKEIESEPESNGKNPSVAIEQDLLRHIYETPPDRMSEMAVLRTRLIHGLTTMQAWEKEFLELVVQIRKYQAWWCLRKTATNGHYDEAAAKLLFEKIVADDQVDVKQLFSYIWRQSLYSHSRSEEGNQLKGARDLEEGIIAVKQQAGEEQFGLNQ